MPIQSYASFMRLTKLCGTRVPQQLLDQINPIRVSISLSLELSVSLIGPITIQHDDQLVKDLGVQVAVDMIRKLSQNNVPGFHFCTLNLEKSVQRVLEQLRWVGAHVVEHNMIISVRLSFNPHHSSQAKLICIGIAGLSKIIAPGACHHRFGRCIIRVVLPQRITSRLGANKLCWKGELCHLRLP
jgi:Methylenetetrahydrofolate reductase